MEPAALERGWRGFARHLLSWLVGFRWIIFLAVFIALFYAEENYRGKRAWDSYKREQKAKGRNLDGSLTVAPKVPNAENFYYAPGMAKWFFGGAPALPSARNNPAGIPQYVRNQLLKVVIEVLPFCGETEPEPANADLVLQYDPPMIRLCNTADRDAALQLDHAPVVIPLIIMDDVPLVDALRNLARQAGANFMLGPGLFFGTGDAEGVPLPQPMVSIRLEEVTAMQAIQVVLSNYDLLWIEDPKTKVARVVRRDPNQPHVILGAGVRKRLEELVSASFGPFVPGVQGQPIFARSIDDARPVRLAIRTHAPLGSRELTFLTSERPDAYGQPLLKDFVIRETPNHCFFVQIPSKSACFASEYLDWSSQYERDFDQMRKALERPYALPPQCATDSLGVTLRLVGETLAQRAQAQLLLGQQSQALRELTLLHDLRRVLNGPPTNRNMTLPTALSDITLAGLHAGVVADGLRMHAWRERELAVLQDQLEGVNLHQTIARLFRAAPAYICSALENAIATKGMPKGPIGSTPQLFFERLMGSGGLAAKLVPRGWFYLSLVKLDAVLQSLDDVHDVSRRFILPHKVEIAGKYVQTIARRISPDTLFARGLGESEVHVYQMTTFTQTSVNQVAVACALERYHLVRGRYPDSLEALVPEFVGVLPEDIINGRPLQYCRIPDEGYQIHSVGWDEKDDRGVPAVQVGWGDYAATGDWTWRFPVN